MTNSSKNTVYQFADFRADVTNKTLVKGGEVIALTPKVFDTLVVLIENAGNLVEKDELMHRIWRDSFVEESNLTFNIKMLRKALNDSATNPTFIETVPRRGYRFIADLQEFNQTEQTEKNNHPVKLPRKFSKFSIAIFVLLVGLVTTVFASLIWQNRNAVANAPILFNEFELSKLSDTGKVFNSAISPDGEFEAYTNETNGKSSLWLRQLETGVNTEIIPPNTDLYYGLKFSKDSKTIYFTRKLGNEGIGIFKVSIFGGVPGKIINNSQGGISISPTDKKIAFIRYEKGVAKINKLIIADIDGNNEQLIKESESNKVFWTAEFSPDGKTIAAAYGNTNNASQEVGLVEINLETQAQREITSTKFFNINSIVWLPNKSGLILAANEKISEPTRLWQVDYRDGKVKSLSKDSMNYSNLSLDKNADKLSAVTVNADFHLFISDTAKPNNVRELVQARDGFVFTNDHRIVYASDTSGSEEIWIMNLDGSNQRQLTNNKNLDAYPQINQDNHIYFTSNRTGQMQVWRMNFDGTEQTQLTKSNGGFPLYISPNSKDIYYQNSTDSNIWKLSVESGEETLILEKKVRPFVAFSPDGKNLAVVVKNKEKATYQIDVMDLATKNIIKTFLPFDEKRSPIYLNWLNDSQTLSYVLADSLGNSSIWIQNLEEAKPKLFNEIGNDEIMDARFSTDGKVFAFIRGNWKHDAILLRGLK